MTAEAVEQKAFPYMSVAIWAKLRRAFFKNLPSKVTKSYLVSAISISEGTAGNVLPQLRNIGLVDKDGVLTDLAKDIRFDTSYPAACKTILTDLYPDEMRDLFHDEDATVEGVSQWIMRETGAGQASATNSAKFYLHLLAGEPPSDELQPRTVKKSKSTSRAKAAAVPSEAQPLPVQEAVETHPQTAAAHARPKHQDGPSLHIDMQVHIDPAATPEQIDSIFASMAKHLYGR